MEEYAHLVENLGAKVSTKMSLQVVALAAYCGFYLLTASFFRLVIL